MPLRHIDCAKAYGNQADVGQGLTKALKEGLVKREDLWITSKLWNSEHNDARAAVEGTLKVRLRVLVLRNSFYPASMHITI